MLRFLGLLILMVAPVLVLIALGHSLFSAPLLLLVFVAIFGIVVSLLVELRRALA